MLTIFVADSSIPSDVSEIINDAYTNNIPVTILSTLSQFQTIIHNREFLADLRTIKNWRDGTTDETIADGIVVINPPEAVAAATVTTFFGATAGETPLSPPSPNTPAGPGESSY